MPRRGKGVTMPHYRYLVANYDIPAENIRAGDLIEIPVGSCEPVGSYRKHGFNVSRFLGYEADGLIATTDQFAGSSDTGAPRLTVIRGGG